MSTKQQKKDRATLIELACAIQSREIITDTQNRFHGKASEETNPISDFYHPDLASHEKLADTARYRLDQVRIQEVGSEKYPQLYQSILSVGIKNDVIVLKNFDESPYEGDAIDGCTRTVLAGEAERGNPNTSSIDVPTIFITDRTLVKLIRRKKKFFQNLLNDHLPCDSASKADTMLYIKEQISREPEPETEEFRADLQDDVYEMVQNNRKPATVKDWISEAYADIEANQNGIQSWRVQSDRHQTIRRQLELSKIRNIRDGWKSDHGLAHKNYKIYSVRCDQGNIEKSAGTEQVRKGEGTDTRPSILIVHTTATKPTKILESQQKVFNKVSFMDAQHITGQQFDYVFMLGQVKLVNVGDLLTQDDVFRCPKLEVVESNV
jgi:hypothetical protein